MSTTSRHQVSEFAVGTSRSSKKVLPEARERSRCHEQLKDMINLLETKYHRKVAGGRENMMDALNATLSSRFIRPRDRK
jgi:TATA-binding protein-associated factor Taf7